MGSHRHTLETRVARRFAPFAAVGLLALLTTALPPQPSNWTLVWIATVLTFAIAAVGVLVPWSRMPRWTFIVPPLSYLVVVALLRQASDGSLSGYAPLAMLPVVWIALNLGRREVVVGIAAGTAVLTVPLVVGNSPNYMVGDWRRAILWAGVAAIVGFAVESLVREKRKQARTAREQAAAIAEHEHTIEAIAGVARALGAGSDARAHICRATLDIAGASFAGIWELDDAGDLVLTGRAGRDPGRTRFRLDEASGTVRAFRRGERYFVADAIGDASLPQAAVLQVGAVSMLFEPIVRGGETIGVLSVGWSRRVDDASDRTTQAVLLLSVEAAVAIERADLVANLSHLAVTDELTGLPNRRTWDDTIHRAVGHAASNRDRLCVAIVDLDHFKAFNDAHGHQAGDRLLKAAAAAWRTALRGADTLARYGGEEFAVALPSCSLYEAELVLERLRRLTPDGQTCSAGLAEWNGSESALEVVARADQALYEAKRSGRDALVTVS